MKLFGHFLRQPPKLAAGPKMDVATSTSNSSDEDYGSFIVVPSQSPKSNDRNHEDTSVLPVFGPNKPIVDSDFSIIEEEKVAERMRELHGHRKYDIGNIYLVVLNPLKHITGVADHAFLSHHKPSSPVLQLNGEMESEKENLEACSALVLYRPLWPEMMKAAKSYRVDSFLPNTWTKIDQLIPTTSSHVEKLPQSLHALYYDSRFSVIAKNKNATLSFASTCRKAVDLFNVHELTRYIWMRFLLRSSLPNSENDPAILTILKGHRILWSEQTALTPSCLCMPLDLLHVPPKFRDRTGASLLSVGSLSSYQELSRQYRKSDLFTIRQLGVRTLNSDLFTTMLSHIDLATQSASWHEDLVKVLMTVCPLSILSHLSLVPLAQPQSSWVSIQGEAHTVYLPSEEVSCPIPTGLGINLIEHSASRDQHRAALFLRLGAVPLGLEEIRKYILELHQSHRKNHLARSCSVIDVVSHAKFLFQNRHGHDHENLSAQLYFADHMTCDCRLQLYRGGRLYCSEDDPLTGFSPTHSLSVCPSVKFIHSEYVSEESWDRFEKIDWLNWLHDQAGISYFPRLFNVKGGLATRTSNVLRHWIERSPIVRLVEDIANHWDSFGVFLSQNVKTREAIRSRLQGIVLPFPDVDALALEMDDTPFLNIEIPTEKLSSFQKLEVFGVSTKPGIQAYLHILKHLTQKKYPVPIETVHAMYKKLQNCSSIEEALIRDTFNENLFIWITRSSPCRSYWMTSECCVWRGPPSLNLYPPLSSQFPDCEKLFCNILNITRQPTVSMLVQELMYQTAESHTFPAESMKPLLFELARCIEACEKEGDWEETLRPLLLLDTMAIFPVRYPDESEVLMASRHDHFFVPDRTERYNLFIGSIPILDASTEEVEALQPLLNVFGGNLQSVSQSIVDDWTIKGVENLDVPWTLKMRSKVPEFLRIICHYVPYLTIPQKEKALKWLTTSCVLKVEAIHRTSEVTYRKRNSKETMTVRASTPIDLCGTSSSEGYIVYIAKDKKRTNVAIRDELPSLLTQYFGLEQYDGADSMIGRVVRLDKDEAIAALDEAGLTMVPESLEKMAARMNIMRTARPRCKDEARWVFASWVKERVLGVEVGQRGHRV